MFLQKSDDEIEKAIAFYRRLLSFSTVESHRVRILSDLHELHLLNAEAAHRQAQGQGAAGFSPQANRTGLPLATASGGG